MSKKHKSSRKSSQEAARRRAEKRASKQAHRQAHRQARKTSSGRIPGDASGRVDPLQAAADYLATNGAPIDDRLAELAERAAKYADNDELRDALKGLSTEELAMYVLLVDKQLKRRRIQLIGYAVALAGFLAGMFLALYFYGNREPGEFIGWVFLIPFTAVAASLVIFGRLARRA